MASQLEERYDERIAGVLSCYDRIVVTGTLPTVCYAAGMTRFLFANSIRIMDYPDFASKLRDRVRERAACLATEAGVNPGYRSIRRDGGACGGRHRTPGRKRRAGWE